MSGRSQASVLLVLGATLLAVSAFSSMYANYVRPGYRPALVVTGVALVLLAIPAFLRRGRAPRVAWLLAAPVFAIVVVVPPPLGSYAARNGVTAPPPAIGYRALGDGVAELTLGEFTGRAMAGRSLAGRRVSLTGFAVHVPGGWYVARMRMACCAADAFVLEVAVEGDPAPREDQWVRVTGTWVPRDEPAIEVDEVAPVAVPEEPYELT
ncbi:TIGR03943 family protein [Nonomuraea sp. PA05]|uniref:TIGR03943 family putative permease subunit n=1 Tax=Nonomuraea sp. PA05 TaxID=2604466 RepID=UPI0011DA5493|nr:TIGR03943 family protein [Nonomuraea sp. PA05]TYB46065.1 TIGR03943 family protein [Nonomuraea sp. PA05]